MSIHQDIKKWYYCADTIGCGQEFEGCTVLSTDYVKGGGVLWRCNIGKRGE